MNLENLYQLLRSSHVQAQGVIDALLAIDADDPHDKKPRPRANYLSTFTDLDRYAVASAVRRALAVILD